MTPKLKKLLPSSVLRNCSLLLLFLLVLQPCRSQDSATQGQKVPAYFPLAKGNSWTYSVSRPGSEKSDMVTWHVMQTVSKQTDDSLLSGQGQRKKTTRSNCCLLSRG